MAIVTFYLCLIFLRFCIQISTSVRWCQICVATVSASTLSDPSAATVTLDTRPTSLLPHVSVRLTSISEWCSCRIFSLVLRMRQLPCFLFLIYVSCGCRQPDHNEYECSVRSLITQLSTSASLSCVECEWHLYWAEKQKASQVRGKYSTFPYAECFEARGVGGRRDLIAACLESTEYSNAPPPNSIITITWLVTLHYSPEILD